MHSVPDSASAANKIKALQTALALISQSEPILKIMCDRHISEYTECDKESDPSKLQDCSNSSSEENASPDANIIVPQDGTNDDDVKIEETEVRTEDEKSSEGKTDDGSEDDGEEQKMLQLMESRLQFLLRSLIKLCSSSSK